MLFKYRGELMLLLVAIIWGSGFIWVDNALSANIGPYTIIALRGLIPGLLLFPYIIKNKFYKNKKLFIYSLFLGITTFLGFACQTVGQQLTTPSNSAFYTCLYVILTPFFALFFKKNDLKKKNILTSLLMLFGIFFMTFMPSIINKEPFEFNIGTLLLIGCAIFFTFQILIILIPLKKADRYSSISIMLLIVGIGGLFGMLINKESFIIKNQDSLVTLSGYFNILLIALLSCLFCYILQFIANKYVSPTKTSLILAMETPFGFLFSLIFLHEPLEWYHFVGLLFVLIAIIITNLNLKRIDVKKYKILLFDLDNTILNFNKSEQKAYFNVFKKYNIKTNYFMFNDFKKINEKLWRDFENNLIEKDYIFESRFIKLFEKYHLKNIDTASFSKDYLYFLSKEAYYLPFTKKALERLSKDHDLYLISNGQIDVQKGRFEIAKLNKYFKGCFISEELGYQKPMKEYFDIVKEKLGYAEKDVLIIGDSLSSDIRGANNANIDCCLVSHGEVETDLKINYQVDSIWQLK